MMLKKYFIMIGILFLSFAQANEKNWFGELGWGIVPSSITGKHESMDTDNLHGVKNNWDAMNKFYGEVGYSFLLKDDSHLLTSIGLETLVSEASISHSTFFVKASLLYPVFIDEMVFNLGPKVKLLLPFTSFYEDSEDGRFTRKVEYDTSVAFAVGLEAVWDVDKIQFVTGVEYLTSSNYEGNVVDSAGYANSTIDLNGVYLNLGVRYRF